MKRTAFTRDEVIELIHELLCYPEQLKDAVNNENTIWHAESLLTFVEDIFDNKE